MMRLSSPLYQRLDLDGLEIEKTRREVKGKEERLKGRDLLFVMKIGPKKKRFSKLRLVEVDASECRGRKGFPSFFRIFGFVERDEIFEPKRIRNVEVIKH